MFDFQNTLKINSYSILLNIYFGYWKHNLYLQDSLCNLPDSRIAVRKLINKWKARLVE